MPLGFLQHPGPILLPPPVTSPHVPSQAAHLPPPQPSSSGPPVGPAVPLSVCPASWLTFTILCSPQGASPDPGFPPMA